MAGDKGNWQARNAEYKLLSSERTMRLAERLIQRGFALAMLEIRRTTTGV